MNSDGDKPSRYQEARADSEAGEPVVTLLRSLVIALSCTTGGVDGPERPADSEEVLLDIDADGYRYLLLRERVPNSPRTLLSPREQEIARMVASGYPSKTIASVLNISCWTVGTHLRRIYAKLGVNTRAGMVGRLHDMRIGSHARATSAVSADSAAAPGNLTERHRA
jgi:DNA-binding CsgD family transcriptional regulator